MHSSATFNAESTNLLRNYFAFWILGMCNNFAYVIMLSAAEDILSVENSSTKIASRSLENDVCKPTIIHRQCSQISTGSVLLANIIPSLIVKIFYTFIMYRVPFGVRHFTTIFLQMSSFVMVAFSTSVSTGLIGVALASFGSGLGEVTFLTLTNYFSSDVVGAWSSGTGGAGIFGSLAYAALTDRHMLGISPQNALLCMLVIPVLFALTYWCVLVLPSRIHRVKLFEFSTYLISSNVSVRRFRADTNNCQEISHLIDDSNDSINSFNEQSNRHMLFQEKLILAKPLLRFMVPLCIVYFAEYFINQGLVELLVFNCSSGFNLPKNGQYRWYQVLYQLGVFMSRSSIKLIRIPTSIISLLPLLQLFNAVFMFWDAIQQFIPHVIIVFLIVFYEGLLGGIAYVNTFHLIHKSVSLDRREFSLGFVSMSDSIGIVCAGFLAIPAHNYICSIK